MESPIETTPRTTANDLDELDVLEALIAVRRTSLLIDSTKSVDDALLVRLCDLIFWAPNHKRTWPWSVAIVRGEGRARLGDACAHDLLALGVTDNAKLQKTRGKYVRSPIVIAVAQLPQVDPHRASEDRDAVAAGIQNFLLGATAAGLATYWGSAPDPTGTHMLDLLGFEIGTRISALIYVGWPSGAVATPERPPSVIGIVE